MDRANRHRMHAKLDTTDLGPRLQNLENNLPTWPRNQLPKRKHSRLGVTCTRMSAGGFTKRVGWRNQNEVLRELEVCPCGARRQVVDGEPEAGWNDINAALKDPDWPTIQRVTS